MNGWVKRKRLLLLIPAVALLALIAGGWLYAASLLKPMPPAESAVLFEVAPGTGSAQIAEQLEQNGLIRSASAFTYYLKLRKQGAKFQAGRYEMAPGITFDAIIAMLNKGQIVKEETVKVTIPEGYTVAQMAEKLQAQAGIDPAAFVAAADRLRVSAGQASAIPDNPALRHRMEGYLFPDTYEWEKDTTPEQIVVRMTAELDRKLQQLPPDWNETLKARGLSFHGLLTVASLIEREVSLDEERPVVAGIIYNRLNKQMHLQIDATVQYLFDKPKERLFEKDLTIESPYNTYLHDGLPPGPIASPSMPSIRAALYPSDTNYLFYVTKKDGSKGHLFAETYEQHQQNIAASKK